jgi:hypothetical protein
MCTYCGTDNYHKIYINHHGPIPKEADGRTYEIHHIDGNHSNNDPENLTAITLQEHYDIHYSRGDFGACLIMSSQRMDKSPEDLSELASKSNAKRISEGNHPFPTRPNGTSLAQDQVANGTHNWLRRADGTSHATDRLEDGTHPFSKEHNPVYAQLANGSHSSQIKISCLGCKKVSSKGRFAKSHAKCFH